ncbi:MAG: hypothetical protein H6Q48_4175 [Deltaproteobacteria bacterium]|nr:hypothetical protein [Deltaproteobacteria bacterium]
MTIGNRLRFLVGQGSLPPYFEYTQNIREPKRMILAWATELWQVHSQFLDGRDLPIYV